MRIGCFLLATLLMVTVLAAPAAADTIALEPVPNADPWFLTNPNDSLTTAITIGYSFKPTQNITVTGLGYQNVFGALVANSFEVGIYSGNYDGNFLSGATLVGSATVDGADPNNGTYWNFAPVSLALTAGVTYTVVAGTVDGNYTTQVGYWSPDMGHPYTNRSVALASEIGYIANSSGLASYGGDGQMKPLTDSWGNASDGNPVAPLPNFTFIPEPATMALLAMGGLALLRRRKRNRAY